MLGYRKIALPISVFPAHVVQFKPDGAPIGDWLIYPLESLSQPQELPEDIDGIIILGGGEDIKSTNQLQPKPQGWTKPVIVTSGAGLFYKKRYPDIPLFSPVTQIFTAV